MLWRSGLLVLLLALLGGCKEETLAQGEIAPALAAFDMQGKEASLDRWRGKSIYLNFWSANCGGCLAEMDTLETLSKRWGEKVMVVAVNTDPASVPLEALLAQHAITYPVLRDQLNITQERYRVMGTPTSVMIDAQGRVLDLHQGARPLPELQQTFMRLARQ
ncbi:TlpA disulfide reductase family protein [Sodalis endosymbiont of Spalangia cameroni]|uniref:TlpA family protein disulfide reductase n=1 Tax=Sodalis praecaptivus TaxID=1239307 RepID=UPI0031F739E8